MTRAAIQADLQAPLEIADLALSGPGPQEVAVDIKAAGVCHSDLSLQEGVVKVPLPVVPGHEGAGVVSEVGAEVYAVQPGDHVVLSWLAECGRCYHCRRGLGYLCESGQQAANAGTMLDGGTRLSRRDGPVRQMSALGTFSERIVVPARSAVKIDQSIPLTSAALFGCGVLTGVGAATKTAQVGPGDTVAVIGCGGVGLNVIQGCALSGAERIIAIDLDDNKLSLAEHFGATDIIRGGAETVSNIMDLTGGVGSDIAFEVIGLEETIQQAVRMTRRGGQVVLVGIPAPEVYLKVRAMAGVVLQAKTIKGCWYGSSDPHNDIPWLLGLAAEAKLEVERLISAVIPLSRINEAYDALRSGGVARSVIEFN